MKIALMGPSRARLVASAAVLALGLASLPCDASPVVAVGDPVRPQDASAIHVTAGIFVSYGVTADPASNVIAERLTIWDAVQRREVVFSVGPKATIDGKAISCQVQTDPHHDSQWLEVMHMYNMCTQLPERLEAGKTWIAILYWDAPKPRNDLQIRDTYPGTDEIHTLYESPPALAR